MCIRDSIKVIPEMVQLNSAESRVNLANISLKQVEETYKRDTQLFKQGVIAQEDFDLSKANYLKAVEEKDNAQSALEIIRDGIAKNSSVASTTQIRSTITGMILDIPVKVGNSVIQANNFNDGTTIATVANMNDMIFKGNVDETEIGRIHEGMPVSYTHLDVYKRQPSRFIVSQVARAVGITWYPSSSSSIKVRVAIASTSGTI